MLTAGGNRAIGFAVRIGLLGLCTVTWLAGEARAQWRQDKANGKVVSVTPDGIRMTGPLNSFITVEISKERLAQLAKDRVLSVTVNGDAESSYLSKDHYVSFSAELTNGTTSTGDVDEVTIFTPDASHPLEMMDTKPDLDDADSGASARPTARRPGWLRARCSRFATGS